MGDIANAVSAAVGDQPLYGIVAIAIALVVTVCVIKKLVKLALVTAVVLGGYLFYLHHTGQQLPRSASDLENKLHNVADDLREAADRWPSGQDG